MKKYFDYNTIYISCNDGITVKYPILSQEDELVITGFRISDGIIDDEHEIADSVKKKYGIKFLEFNEKLPFEFYCVPYIDIFAYDEKGVFATLSDVTDCDSNAPVVYIDALSSACKVSDNFSSFINLLLDGSFSKDCMVQLKDICVFKNRCDADKHLEII